MIISNINYRQNLFIFLSGCSSALALPPIFLFPFWIFSICALLHYISEASDVKHALKFGFLWGFGHFLFGLYWISNGPATYSQEFWWAIPLALFGIPLILALFTSLISCISWFFSKKSSFSIYFAIIWVFFEWVREWLFTGFPWNSVNYMLHFSDILIQTSALWGPYGQSLFTIFFAVSFYDLYYHASKKNFLLAILWLFFIVIYGFIKLEDNETKHEYRYYIRLVQPSTIQGQKWNYDLFIKELDKLVTLSNEPSVHKIDLVIWPESAVIVSPNHKFILDKLTEATKDNKILLTGGEIEKGRKNYTSIYAVNNSGNIISEAHKYHLVPFGEYIPLQWLWPNIKKLTPGLLDWDHGDKNSMIQIDNLKIMPLICYEGLFASEVNSRFFRDIDFFVHITNDSFYGNTTGPYQHFEQSRARAVEHNRPLLRVGSNGISAFIDKKGRVTKKINLNQIGILDDFIEIVDKDLTAYSRHGSIVVVIMTWILCIYGCFSQKRQNHTT